MKKIAIITSQAHSLINFRGPLIQDLLTLGHDVYALAPDFDVVSRTKLQTWGVHTIDIGFDRAGLNPVVDLWTMAKLAVKLRSIRPTTVLCYFVKPVIYGTLSSFLAGAKYRISLIEGLGYAFTDRANIKLTSRILSKCVSWMYRFSLLFSAKVIFLNPDDKEEFLNRKLVNPDKTRLIDGIGLTLNEWPYVEKNVDKSPLTFIMVARLLADKGIYEYINAIKIIRQYGLPIRAILLGDVDANPASIQQVEVLDWVHQGLIEWPGYVSVQPWLAQSHVFVLPSYREGLPRSIQEAMSTGMPIITTDVPGCRQTVEHGVNGFLVPPRDAASLATAMKSFILSSDLVQSMGFESRKMAEQRFEVHAINRQIIEIMGLSQSVALIP